MVGGDEEDPRQELERLERDLAAIDARWASEGYQQRTTSKVLDDERRTHHELTLRIAALRRRERPATPAVGTGLVRTNVGAGWAPMPFYERPLTEQTPNELAPAAFDVEPLDPGSTLERLHEELFDAFTTEKRQRSTDWIDAFSRLKCMAAKWGAVPGANRLLAAAFRSIGADFTASQLHPVPALSPRFVEELRAPLLTEASELPNIVSGLTTTQRTLLSLMSGCAPETGPFVSLSAILSEARLTLAELTEKQLVRELLRVGHPAHRRLPLVAFQGLQGRLELDGGSFTHARLTVTGRDLVEGRLALPLLLVNGAAGDKACVLPCHPGEVARACLMAIEESTYDTMKLMRAIRAFDLPDGAQCAGNASFDALSRGRGLVEVRANVEIELLASERRARLVVTALPWPMTSLNALSEVERAISLGFIDGVVATADESSADATRVVIELESPVFADFAMRALSRRRAFSVVYPVTFAVVDESGGRTVAVWSIIKAFIVERTRVAARELERAVGRARVRAQECEGVCVALELLDRVLGVMRNAISDAEAVTGLLTFMRPDDRQQLKRAGLPLSHAYEMGFSLEQARFLVKQRKLGTKAKEAARTDWIRALEAIDVEQSKLADRDALLQIVRREVKEMVERYRTEPRRSKVFE